MAAKKGNKNAIGKKKNNPNGANQYKVDPRQALFLAYYLDPKSDTFSNALQSALKAGYEQQYAESLTAKMPDWLSEKVGDKLMLSKAEKNLNEMLDMPVRTLEWEGHGEDAEQVVTTEPALVKIKQDTAKFVAERLGKGKWSSRNELTGKDGNPIEIKQITGMQIIQDNADSIKNEKSETD